jgi:hypothetical protein
MSLRDLLTRGYFPKELPRPFDTASFAKCVSTARNLPGDFAKTAARGNKLPSAQTGVYSLARGGLLRRPLSICNPLHHFLLCNELIQNWAAIKPRVAGTSVSATTPEFKKSGRAIDGKHPQSERDQLARNTRLGRRYVLLTDINRFYHSIYTHSISWAMHTKATAKANRSLNLLGNKIDFWIRMGQDQQTVGIPIGPDTSLLMAELIMQRCDEALIAAIPQLRGHRFIDDYELSFQTRTEAEDAFHVLDTCLADFELALNLKKTKILELPLPLEPSWTTELKDFRFSRNSQHGQAADLNNYFNKAFALHSSNPSESVLNFAIAKLRGMEIDPANWKLFQKLLLLCATPEPASLPYVLEQIITRKNAGAPLLVPEIEEVANELIVKHSARRHSSEVANAAWACLALRLRLHEAAVDAISRCDDSVVALLALDCEQHGLVAKPLDKSLWSAHMTHEALYDKQWLLAYEANIKKWLPNTGGIDHVSRDVNFGFLKRNKVSFYKSRLTTPGRPTATKVPLPTLPTRGRRIIAFAGYH